MKAEQLPLRYPVGTVLFRQTVFISVTTIDGIRIGNDHSYEVAIVSIKLLGQSHVGVDPAERRKEDGIVQRMESGDLPRLSDSHCEHE